MMNDHKKDNRSERIDLLRGIGVLLIILVHTAQKYTLPEPIACVCAFGQYACQLFFVISGYLAWKSLSRNNTGVFYQKRAFSIFPGYWITILFFLLLNTIWQILYLRVPYQWNHSLLGVGTNVLGIHGFFPSSHNNVVPGGWYVGTTVILYALSPLLKRIILRLRHNWIVPVIECTFSIAIQYLIGWATGSMELSENNHFLYFSFINQSIAYTLGMLLGEKAERKPEKERKWTLPVGILLVSTCIPLSAFDEIPMPMVMPAVVGLGWTFILDGALHEKTACIGRGKDFAIWGSVRTALI